jgi:hypothetical protein
VTRHARRAVGLNHGDGNAPQAPFGDGADVLRDPLAAGDRLLSRTNESAVISLRDHVGREQALERGDVAGLRRGNERMQEALLLVVADACSPSTCHMLACASDELTRVGLFDAENFGDFFVRVVECLAQHVRGALGRREAFEQHEDRELQCLATLGAH